MYIQNLVYRIHSVDQDLWSCPNSVNPEQSSLRNPIHLKSRFAPCFGYNPLLQATSCQSSIVYLFLPLLPACGFSNQKSNPHWYSLVDDVVGILADFQEPWALVMVQWFWAVTPLLWVLEGWDSNPRHWEVLSFRLVFFTLEWFWPVTPLLWVIEGWELN